MLQGTKSFAGREEKVVFFLGAAGKGESEGKRKRLTQ